MSATEIVLVVGVAAFTLIGAIWDTRWKKLPNALTVPAFGLAIAFHLAIGASDGGWRGALGNWRQEGLVFALAGFGVGFGILFVLWLIGGGGGGDVKMMGALGAWLGVDLILKVFFVSTLFVILGSLGLMVYRVATQGLNRFRRRHLAVDKANPSPNKAKAARQKEEQRLRRRLMPYGVPVALATWAVLAADIVMKKVGG